PDTTREILFPSLLRIQVQGAVPAGIIFLSDFRLPPRMPWKSGQEQLCLWPRYTVDQPRYICRNTYRCRCLLAELPNHDSIHILKQCCQPLIEFSVYHPCAGCLSAIPIVTHTTTGISSETIS